MNQTAKQVSKKSLLYKFANWGNEHKGINDTCELFWGFMGGLKQISQWFISLAIVAGIVALSIAEPGFGALMLLVIGTIAFQLYDYNGAISNKINAWIDQKKAQHCSKIELID